MTGEQLDALVFEVTERELHIIGWQKHMKMLNQFRRLDIRRIKGVQWDLTKELLNFTLGMTMTPGFNIYGKARRAGGALDDILSLSDDALGMVPRRSAGKATQAARKITGAKGPPRQVHHFATNKNSVYTPQMKKIADRYGLDLDDVWNKELLPQQGRHPNAYHEFVERSMQQAAEEAGDDAAKFLQLFEEYVKKPVRQNPNLLRRKGWE